MDKQSHVKKLCKNNKFNISVPTASKKFDLPYGSYSVLVIQDYFAYIIKIHEKFIDNPPIQVYINQIEKKKILLKLNEDIMLNFFVLNNEFTRKH